MNGGKMVPVYAVCISDLGPDDRVHIHCACQRLVIFPPRFLLQEMRLQPDDRIADLAARLRCRECDERGKVVVIVKWKAG